MKKAILFLLLAFCFAVSVHAQQVTRIAVVDMPRVYNRFPNSARPWHELARRRERVMAEINGLLREIQDLQARRQESVRRGDMAQAQQLETEINSRSEVFQTIRNTRLAELETEEKNANNRMASFRSAVRGAIASIAQPSGGTAGYSIVINGEENSDVILWYSRQIDITQRVIDALAGRYN